MDFHGIGTTSKDPADSTLQVWISTGSALKVLISEGSALRLWISAGLTLQVWISTFEPVSTILKQTRNNPEPTVPRPCRMYEPDEDEKLENAPYYVGAVFKQVC